MKTARRPAPEIPQPLSRKTGLPVRCTRHRETSCNVTNLRRVSGRSSVGGYVGLASAASSLLSADTNASDGLLQGILDSVLSNVGDLVQVLPATVTTIHQARVSPADPDWGFVVDGSYTVLSNTEPKKEIIKYASCAGGFAGELQAAFLGQKDAGSACLQVNGLRQVDGGRYAGGFVGLGDVNAVAEVAGNSTQENQTTVLDTLLGGLLSGVAGLDPVDVLDVLRSYIFCASVTGVKEGYRVEAHDSQTTGILNEKRQQGCAGGFAGAMLNGTIQDCAAGELATVQAPNYTGGFIGHMGKSGAVDVDDVNLLSKLVNLTAGVADLFGTQVVDCSVTGYASGMEVQAAGGQQPIAGGFAGYADLGRVTNCTVGAGEDQPGGLKKVSSGQVAGGFVGQTDMAYLVSLEANSQLLNGLLQVVNTLLEYLYLDDDKLEDINLIDLNLGILRVEALSEWQMPPGNRMHGNSLVVSLSKNNEQDQAE